ncbi:Crystal protein ET79 [Penicillium verhagenii]|nr:Crystal protein ET79 [Penicillium verhagenii]
MASTGLNMYHGVDNARMARGDPWRSVYINLRNDSDRALTLSWNNLHYGDWAHAPPQSIAAHSSGSFWNVQMASGPMHGVEADVAYNVESGGSFVLHWVNPMVGSNSYEVRDQGSLSVNQEGDGSGNNSEITWVFRG